VLWHIPVYKFDLFSFFDDVQEKLKKAQLNRDQAIKGVKQDEGKTTASRRQGDQRDQTTN